MRHMSQQFNHNDGYGYEYDNRAMTPYTPYTPYTPPPPHSAGSSSGRGFKPRPRSGMLSSRPTSAIQSVPELPEGDGDGDGSGSGRGRGDGDGGGNDGNTGGGDGAAEYPIPDSPLSIGQGSLTSSK